MNTDKPPFRVYYGRNAKWLLIFLIGTNITTFILTKIRFFDVQTFQIWFWICTALFIVSIVGSLIEYGKTYHKQRKK